MNSARGGNPLTNARISKKWKSDVQILAQVVAPPKPYEFAEVKMIRHSAVQPDYGNLVESFKPLLDGLKGIWIVDDDPDHVLESYEWQCCARGQKFVELVCTPLKR